MIIELRNCSPERRLALGATLAEQHMAPLHKALASGLLAAGSLVVLDFKGIEGVNGSYIKGTALWLLSCGRLFANIPATDAPRHPADPRPYDLYVCVTGLSLELETEFQEFFWPRGLPLLGARRVKGEVIQEAELLGRLDPVLALTLKIVTRAKTVTAPELFKNFPDQHITVTAWNNRLNDLNALRLLRRIRAGRAWKYEPVAKKILWE